MISTLSLTTHIEEVFDNNKRIGDQIPGYHQVFLIVPYYLLFKMKIRDTIIKINKIFLYIF